MVMGSGQVIYFIIGFFLLILLFHIYIYIFIYLIWILPSTRVQYIPPILHSFVRCFLLLYSSRCPYAMHV